MNYFNKWFNILNKNLKMNKNWFYALSVEGRNEFEKGNKETKTLILLQLVENDNISMTKLMQIDFYYDALNNYKTPQDYADFWIELLHLGMKVGDGFAPHAKIS